MATQVQFRRGTSAQSNAFTGGAGEITVNMSNMAMRIHDGATVGGFEMARADLTNVTGNIPAQPGGVNAAVQFNDLGVMGGSSTYTYDSINQIVTMPNVAVSGTVGSDLIPNANATYSLGNSTNYWKDLYLSGNTIYIGNAEIHSVQEIVLIKGLSITANGAAPATLPTNGQLSVEGAAVIAGNLTAPNATFATTLIANVAQLTSANVTGNLVANLANVADLQATNLTVANITITGNANVSEITNGTSNIVVSADGNISMSVAGNANVVVVTDDGLDVKGNLLAEQNVLISGNLTVNGNTNYLNVTSLSVSDPILGIGGGANNTPLVLADGKDRGTALTTYGDGKLVLSSGITPAGNIFIELTNTVGVSAGMGIGISTLPNLIPSGAVITAVNASNVEIDTPLLNPIPGGTQISVGTDTIRFMGWDDSSGQFAFGSDVTITNDVVSYNALGNIVAGTYIGEGLMVSDLANVFIPGGTNGQTIVTDGLGNLTWADGGTAGGLAATDLIIPVGETANGLPYTADDSKDRGMSMVSYGGAITRTSSGDTALGNVVIALGGTLGVEVGQQLSITAQPGAFTAGTVVDSIDVVGATVTINNPTLELIPDNTVITFGTDIIEFMGWDSSNAEFAFGSNVSIVNDVVTFNEFGNIRAHTFIGNIVGGGVTNGNSSVTVPDEDGNILLTANNNIVLTVTPTSILVDGDLDTTDKIATLGVTANGLPYATNDNKDRGISMVSYGNGATLTVATTPVAVGDFTITVASVTGAVVGQAVVFPSQLTAFPVNTVITAINVPAKTLTVSQPADEIVALTTPFTVGSNKQEFMGWDTSAGKFVLGSNVTIAGDVVTVGTYGNLQAGSINVVNAHMTGNVLVDLDTEMVGNLQVDGDTLLQGNVTATGDLTTLDAYTTRVTSVNFQSTTGVLAMGVGDTGNTLLSNTGIDTGIVTHSYGDGKQKSASGNTAIGNTVITLNNVTGLTVGQQVYSYVQPNAFDTGSTVTAIDIPNSQITVSAALLEQLNNTTAVTFGTDVLEFMGWDNSNAEFAFGRNVSVTNDVVTFNAMANVRAATLIGSGLKVPNVANVYISGGTAGQVLTTDGSGNLSWASADAPSALVGTDLILPIGVTADDTPYIANDNKDRGISMSSYGNAVSLTIDGDVAIGATDLIVLDTTGAEVGQPVVVPTQLGALTVGTTITAIDVPTKTITLSDVTVEAILDTTVFTVGTNNTEFMGWDESADEFILGSNVTIAGDVVTVDTYGNLRAGTINVENAGVTGNLQVDTDTLLQGNVTTTGTVTRLGGVITKVESQFFGTTAGTLSMGLGTDDQPLYSNTATDTGIVSHSYGNVTQKTAVGNSPLGNTVLTLNNVTNIAVGQVVYSYDQPAAVVFGTTVTAIDIPNSQVTIDNALIEQLDSGNSVTFGSDNLEFMGFDNSNAEFAFGRNVDFSGTEIVFNTMANVRAATFKGTGLRVPNVANIYVEGGSAGQVLGTDGAGNLAWVSGAAPGTLTNQEILLPIGNTATNTPYTANDNKDRGLLMNSYGNAAALTTDGETALGATTLVVVSTTGAVVGQAIVVPTQLTALTAGTTITAIDVPTKTLTLSAATLEIIPTATNVTVGSNNLEFIGWDESADEFTFGSNVSVAGNVVTVNTLGNVRADTFIGAVKGNLVNGNSNVTVAANGAVAISSTGVANVIVATDTAVTVTANLAVNGQLSTTDKIISAAVATATYTTNDNADRGVTTTSYGGAVALTIDGAVLTGATDLVVLDTTGAVVGQVVIIPTLPAALTVGTTITAIDVPTKTITISSATLAGIPDTTSITVGSNNTEFFGWDESADEFIVGSSVTIAGNVVTVGTYGNLHASKLTGTGLRVPNVANIYVEGGVSGQVLGTDGLGNLSWIDGIAPGTLTDKYAILPLDQTMTGTPHTSNDGKDSGISMSLYGNAASLTLDNVGGTDLLAGATDLIVLSTTGAVVGQSVVFPTQLTALSAGTTISAIDVPTKKITISSATLEDIANGVSFTVGSDNTTFMGWDNSAEQYIFGSNVTIAGDVVTVNTYANVQAETFIGEAAELSNATVTTNLTAGNALITGNLTVSGTTTYINTENEYITDAVIVQGAGANFTPLMTDDGKDRGTALHTFGTAATYTTDGSTTLGATTVVLTSVAGIAVGQSVMVPTLPNAIASGTTVTLIDVPTKTVTLSAATLAIIPTTTAVTIGDDVVRFMGWDSSNAEFAFGSNVSVTNDVVTFDALGNVRADYFIGNGANLDDLANVKIGGGSNNQFITTDGDGNLSWTSSKFYTSEYHVDPANGDDSFTGSYSHPWKTLAKAISVLTTGQILILHRGTYSENITFTETNLEIRGESNMGGLIYVTGDWTFNNASSSIRVWSINFAAGTTQTIAGAGSVYFRNCNSSGALVKTGGGYMQAIDSDFAGAGIFINGGNQSVFQGGTQVGIVVNSAGAIVSVQSSLTVAVVMVLAGMFIAQETFIFSQTNTAKAITTSAGSFTYLYNCKIVTPSQTAARMQLAGAWSLTDTLYDKTNSTLTGTNLGSVTYSDAINVYGNITVGGKSNLGNIGNVKITGGANLQFVQTDGNGNLVFADVSNLVAGNSNIQVVANSDIVMSSNGQANIVTINSNGTHALTTFVDDVTITGNFTVSGTETIVNTVNETLENPIMSLGTAANSAPLIVSDGKDRGISMHTYGDGQAVVTSGSTPAANTFIELTDVTGITVGMVVGLSTSNVAIVPGTTVISVNASNIELSDPTGDIIADATSLNIGNDTLRFMGWDVSNTEFVVSSATTINNNVVTVDALGNIRADYFIGNISGTDGEFTANLTVAEQVTANIVSANSFINGNSNVSIATDGNISMGVTGTANVVVVSADGVEVTGTTSISGNLSVANIETTTLYSGNSNVTIGSSDSITFGAVGNANVVTITGTGLVVSGNIDGSTFQNGTSNVIIAADADVVISSNGQSNIVTVNSNGTHALTSFIDDVNISGNLVVTGSVISTNTETITVQNPILNLGIGVNDAPLTAPVSQDRGISMHTYGVGLNVVTSGLTATANTFIELTDVTGITVGMTIGDVGAQSIVSGTTIVAVNASNVEISNATLLDIADATTLAVGTDVLRFMGWDISNTEFVVSATTTINNGLITVGSLGNIRADNLLGNVDGNVATFSDDVTVLGNVNVPTVQNGNSNVYLNANGNIVMNVTGTADVAIFSDVGVEVANALTVGGLVTLTDVANLVITGGSEGQVLSTDGAGTLSWADGGASSWKAKTTALAFDSATSVAALTLPANAIVDRVTVIVDTAFDDTPTMTVGINGGSATAYSVVTDVTLTEAGRYDIPSAVAPSSSSTDIEIYFDAAGTTVGAARVLITYCIPD